MDYQRPDPEQGSSQYSARVEDDFVRPLQPMKSVSQRRLPAALPLALAGILVVSSVAFGAAVIRNAVTPPPDASGVVVGDESQSAEPSVEVSAAPVESQASEESATPAPTPPVLTLEASISGGQVALAWTRYQGEDFAYYKVVRSTDATVSWPLDGDDTLVAAISDIDKLSTVDAAPAGKTFTYEVFAVKSSEDGYAVLVGSNVVTIAVPVPTPKPTQDCSMSLSVKIETGAGVGGIQPAVVGSHAPATKVTFTWTKYKCDYFEWYVLVKSPDATIVVPVSTSSNDEPSEITSNVSVTSTSVNLGPGTYYFLVMAWNSKVLCYGGTVLAKTNVVKVVIP